MKENYAGHVRMCDVDVFVEDIVRFTAFIGTGLADGHDEAGAWWSTSFAAAAGRCRSTKTQR